MTNRSVFPWVFLGSAVLSLSTPAHSQEFGSRDLDIYYRYPLAISARYDSISPFPAYGALYNVFSIGGAVTAPLQSLPEIQPTLDAGMTTFDSQDSAAPEKWDHTTIYGTLGAGYVRRLSKDFEIGATAALGAGVTTFPSLIEEPVGYTTLLAAAGLKIGLSPTYNLHIAVEPRLTYQYALTDLTTFNGLSFGVGFSASYRFGDDPDAPQNAIRALDFVSVDVPDLFAAMQSFYADNPMGSVELVNTERTAIEDVTVAFFQQGLMDSPTESATVERIEPGQSVRLPLAAVFNSTVFDLEGTTPLSGEVLVNYTVREREVEQRQSVSYDLYDKTALTWDDDRKVAAFITPADSALRNYQAALQRYTRSVTRDGVSDALEAALAAYTGLVELGIIYQVDPTSPFVAAQSDTVVVDSVSLPRDTLQRFAGDCDDLTVLYCTMLESAGVETGFITVPGHIYPVVNTRVPANQFGLLHPDREMTINVDGELWLPVEITLLGRESFRSAWRRGIELYNQYRDDPEVSGFYRTAGAQSVYRPVGLRQTDLGLQYGSEVAVRTQFGQELSNVVAGVLQSYEERARESDSSRNHNRLGIAAARLGEYGKAESAFRSALRLDGSFVDARVNLGALQVLQGEHFSAVLTLQNAAAQLERSGDASEDSLSAVYINLAKAHYSMEEFDDAERYFDLASNIDPERAADYSYIAAVNASGDGARAAETTSTGVPFAGEE